MAAAATSARTIATAHTMPRSSWGRYRKEQDQSPSAGHGSCHGWGRVTAWAASWFGRLEIGTRGGQAPILDFASVVLFFAPGDRRQARRHLALIRNLAP